MPVILDDDLAAKVHNALVELLIFCDDSGEGVMGDAYCKLMMEYEACYKRRISSQLFPVLSNTKSRPASQKPVQTTFFP